MGAWLNKLWWGADPDEPDPTSGLSRRDIYMIQRSWTPIYSEAYDYGLQIFKRLFRKEPESKLLFKMIREMNEDEMSKSAQFKAHVINFMSTLNMIVNNLTQPEVAAAMMQKLGTTHKRHKVTRQHCETIVELFLEFFKMDRCLKSPELAAWIRFLTFFQKELLTTLS